MIIWIILLVIHLLMTMETCRIQAGMDKKGWYYMTFILGMVGIPLWIVFWISEWK